MVIDVQGKLWVVDEGANAIHRFDQPACDRGGSDCWTTVLNSTVDPTMATPQGVAVAPDNGDVFWSEYGVFGAEVDDLQGRGKVAGVALQAGRVKVMRAVSGDISVVANGFWRCRGIALQGKYLYIANEANAWDQPSSGAISRYDRITGTVQKLAIGLDYPQFPAIAGPYLFVPLALRDRLVALDLRPHRGFVRQTSVEKGVIVAATGGTWTPVTGVASKILEVSVSDTPFTQARALRGALSGVDVNGRVSMWIKIPAHMVTVYKGELPYNDGFHPGPGRFELPPARCAVTNGTDGRIIGTCTTSVLVLHEHMGARWPMLVYNRTDDFHGRWSGRLFPSVDYHNAPAYYLVFVHVKL